MQAFVMWLGVEKVFKTFSIFTAMQSDILAVGVHPDDIELSCSGTLLRQIDAGYSVALLDLTEGELGTRGNPELRLKEAEASKTLMGAVARYNAGMPDGFFSHSEENLRTSIKFIRHFQPRIVIANALADRHPDHGRAAKLVADACFFSGLRKIETLDDLGQLQQVWRPRVVYHAIQDYRQTPDFVVDISDFMQRKMDLVMAFRSQFYDPDSTEPDSPISGKDFLDFLYARARDFGRPAGYDYAEGFQATRLIGVRDLFDLD